MKKQAVLDIKPLGFPWETANPFLFCVHHEDFYPKGKEDLSPNTSLTGRNLGQDFTIKDGFRMYHGHSVPGFPSHPHRGFETITVVQKGLVDHADSMGASGRYGYGDVQWMTAGKGIQHSEMFPLLNQNSKNTLELFQIWINLPAKDKMVEPHFTMLWKEDIPIYTYKDDKGKATEIEVVAGNIDSLKAPHCPPNSWAAAPENEVAVWPITMEAGANFTLPKAGKGVNRKLYFYKGKSMDVAGQNIPLYNRCTLDPEAEAILSNGSESSKLLLLQGKPIEEPVVQYGPFVMNTEQEIQQAYSDFQKTRFGGWPWKSSDPTHGNEKIRFAKHADGNKILKKV